VNRRSAADAHHLPLDPTISVSPRGGGGVAADLPYVPSGHASARPEPSGQCGRGAGASGGSAATPPGPHGLADCVGGDHYRGCHSSSLPLPYCGDSLTSTVAGMATEGCRPTHGSAPVSLEIRRAASRSVPFYVSRARTGGTDGFCFLFSVNGLEYWAAPSDIDKSAQPTVSRGLLVKVFTKKGQIDCNVPRAGLRCRRPSPPRRRRRELNHGRRDVKESKASSVRSRNPRVLRGATHCSAP
jgi:hypothetical protein